MTASLQRRNVLVSPLLAFAAASCRGHVADAVGVDPAMTQVTQVEATSWN